MSITDRTGKKKALPPKFTAGEVICGYRILVMVGREYKHDRMDYLYRAVCVRCGQEALVFQRRLLAGNQGRCTSCGLKATV